MAAPKNNQFWKNRSKHGRDKLFATPELLLEAAHEYFKWCDENPIYETKVGFFQGVATQEKVPRIRAYTLSGLCLYLGCSRDFFYSFEQNNKDSKDFIDIINIIKESIYVQKFEGAAADQLNANIIARELGLTDKKEIDQKTITLTDSERDEKIKELLKKAKEK